MRARAGVIGLMLVLGLSACVNQPRNYIPAGFKSQDEALQYAPDYLYYAAKITPDEWAAFYQRFPEYWQDLQLARQMGARVEFHPLYTAYAFKWNTDRRRAKWDAQTVQRLAAGTIEPGDDVFKVIVARGVPARIVQTNDFELLAYQTGDVLQFNGGTFATQLRCTECAHRPNPGVAKSQRTSGLDDAEVIEALGLKPPKY